MIDNFLLDERYANINVKLISNIQLALSYSSKPSDEPNFSGKKLEVNKVIKLITHFGKRQICPFCTINTCANAM